MTINDGVKLEATMVSRVELYLRGPGFNSSNLLTIFKSGAVLLKEMWCRHILKKDGEKIFLVMVV